VISPYLLDLDTWNYKYVSPFIEYILTLEVLSIVKIQASYLTLVVTNVHNHTSHRFIDGLTLKKVRIPKLELSTKNGEGMLFFWDWDWGDGCNTTVLGKSGA
jgi:hypothetical protein